METIKEFLSLQQWWKLVAFAGVAIAVAGVGRSLWGILIGIGLLLFGCGVWACHPKEKQKETVEGLRGFKLVDAYPWKPNAFGVGLSAIGTALFGIGLYQLIMVS